MPPLSISVYLGVTLSRGGALSAWELWTRPRTRGILGLGPRSPLKFDFRGLWGQLRGLQEAQGSSHSLDFWGVVPSLHGAKWVLIGDSCSKGPVVGFGGNSKMHQDASRGLVTTWLHMGPWGPVDCFRTWESVKPIRDFVRRAHGTSVILNKSKEPMAFGDLCVFCGLLRNPRARGNRI